MNTFKDRIGDSLHRDIQRLQQSSTTTHSEGFLVTTGLGFFKQDLNDCDLLGRLTVRLALDQYQDVSSLPALISTTSLLITSPAHRSCLISVVSS